MARLQCRTLRHALLAAGLALLLTRAHRADAATAYTWSGTAGDHLWDSDTNWGATSTSAPGTSGKSCHRQHYLRE